MPVFREEIYFLHSNKQDTNFTNLKEYISYWTPDFDMILKIIGDQNQLPIIFGTAYKRIKKLKVKILSHTNEFLTFKILL